MISEPGDTRDIDCPSHEACGGWCDQHQIITESDSAYLGRLLVDFKKGPRPPSLDDYVTWSDVLDSIQLVIRERLYVAWDDGMMAGRESQPHSEPPVNPYGWTRD